MDQHLRKKHKKIGLEKIQPYLQLLKPKAYYFLAMYSNKSTTLLE